VKYSEALAAVRGLDGGAELAQVIAEQFAEVQEKLDAEKSKTYSLIGEKRSVGDRVHRLESAIIDMSKSVGFSDESDIGVLLEQIPDKVKSYSQQNSELSALKEELEARATEAEGKVKIYDRANKWQELANKAEVNQSVLEKLLGEKFDEISIDEEQGVVIDGKPLREYVEADESLNVFAPALFREAAAENNRRATLPGAPPRKADKKEDPVAAYRNRHFGGARALGLVKQPAN